MLNVGVKQDATVRVDAGQWTCPRGRVKREWEISSRCACDELKERVSVVVAAMAKT